MKKRSFYIPRTVKARMLERYIFNFRLKPEALAEKLPVGWLEPQIQNGWSVISFCILKLDQLTIAPLPPLFGYKTLSCAYRAGIVDRSGGKAEPSVYITDRNADLPLITKLGPLIFLDSIPAIHAAIGQADGKFHTQLSYLDSQHLFSAESKLSDDPTILKSEVFGSLDDFASFIKTGVSSYTPSVHQDYLTRVDLYKEDAQYQALDAEIEFSWLDGAWKDAGLIYDSAVRATGSNYHWTYRGLVKK